ncbi:MAG: hypothetical protein GY757_01425 [bacterium]|nr:hypothetical protein [bacterium]
MATQQGRKSIVMLFLFAFLSLSITIHSRSIDELVEIIRDRGNSDNERAGAFAELADKDKEKGVSLAIELLDNCDEETEEISEAMVFLVAIHCYEFDEEEIKKESHQTKIVWKAGRMLFGTKPGDALIRAVNCKHVSIKTSAIRHIGELKLVRAEDTLLEALSNDHPDVLKAIEDALDEIKSKKATKHFMSLYLNGKRSAGARKIAANYISRDWMFKSLADAEKSTLLKRMRRDLTGSDSQMRSVAVHALGNTRSPKALTPLINAYKNNPALRPAVISSLGRLRSAKVYEIFLDAITDKNPAVRKAVVQTLWFSKKKEAGPVILKALQDNDSAVKQGALNCVRQRKVKHEINKAALLLNDKDWDIRKMAMKVLQELDWKPANKKETALFYIAKGEYADCFKLGEPALIPLVDTIKFEKIRYTVLRAIYRLGDPAVELLRMFMKDKHADKKFRFKVVRALDSIRTAKTVPVLIEALNDSEYYVKNEAITALGKSKSADAVKPLKEFLNDPNELTRNRAAKALKKLGVKPQPKKRKSGVLQKPKPAKKPLKIDLSIGLVAHFPFDRNAGKHHPNSATPAFVYDASSNNRCATSYGGPAWTVDRFGKANSAYRFDGVNDKILIASNKKMRSAHYTVSFFAATTHKKGISAVICGEYTRSYKNESRIYTTYYSGYGIYIGSRRTANYRSDHFTATKPNRGRFGALATVEVSDGKWHHIAATWDGKIARIYIDGKLRGIQFSASTKYRPGPICWNKPGLSHLFYVGYSKLNSEFKYFKGDLDDLRIYSRALKPAEIQILYKKK